MDPLTTSQTVLPGNPCKVEQTCNSEPFLQVERDNDHRVGIPTTPREPFWIPPAAPFTTPDLGLSTPNFEHELGTTTHAQLMHMVRLSFGLRESVG